MKTLFRPPCHVGVVGRWMLRRAYNAGNDAKAQRLAMKLIDKGHDALFAQDVLIRSLWRTSAYDKVLEFTKCWPEADFYGLGTQAAERLQGHRPIPRIRHGKTPPRPLQTVEFSATDMVTNWHQIESDLWFQHPDGWVHWTMPDGWELGTCHPSLLELSADVLLRPWVTSVRSPLTPGRVPGTELALSWSAGTDSTAAMQLLPTNTILGYHRRTVEGLLDHRNADRTIAAVQNGGYRVVTVPSDHEIIRTHHGKSIGFSTDYASGVHLILLADFLNLGGIAFGVPSDNTWLWKGRKFRDFPSTHHWKTWSARFLEAGLHLVLPINHISEAGAMRIVSNGPWANVVNSCMRGNGKMGCERCWKCFLKNGPLGRPFDEKSREIKTFLRSRPLRTAQHALWAIQSMNVEHLVPDLAHLLEEDLSWWEEAYAPGLELIPSKWREGVEERTREYSLQILDEDSPLSRVDIKFETDSGLSHPPEASKTAALEG